MIIVAASPSADGTAATEMTKNGERQRKKKIGA